MKLPRPRTREYQVMVSFNGTIFVSVDQLTEMLRSFALDVSGMGVVDGKEMAEYVDHLAGEFDVLANMEFGGPVL